MMTQNGLQRSRDVKEVIHVKANKFTGYFDADCKKFAIDPHVTSFADIKEILVNAFNLVDSFNISYLCRDDKGEDIYLSLLTDWDLDAAFLTSSDPCLFLKVELEHHRGENLRIFKKEVQQSDDVEKNSESLSGFAASTGFQVPRGWTEFAENAIAKITNGIGQASPPHPDEKTFFPRKAPLGDCELHDYLDEYGRLVRPADLRLCIYYGGVEPSLRKVVWRLLLNIFPENFTASERVAYMKKKTKEYHQLYTQWKSLHNNRYVQELKRMIWKDVRRTDRSHTYFHGSDDNPHLVSLHNLLLTYALTHEKVRYCQGMSDLVAPILVVMNNEPHAYVCFCGLMSRLESNFYNDGEVMSKKFEHLALLLQYHDFDYFSLLKRMDADNMYFCYRWLLLEMKREFNFDDALLVLEVIWSSLPPQPPERDLPLGNISIPDESFGSKSCHVAANKRNSLPDLTLSVKNLPTILRVGASSSGNLADLVKKESILVNDSQHSELPYTKKQYSVELNQSKYLLTPRHGDAVFMPNLKNRQIKDGGIKFGPSAIISSEKRRSNNVLLPPPEQLGCGNPFLLFVCLSVLLEQKEELITSEPEYADLVMHLNKMVRRHSPAKILSKAMEFFALYLQSQSSSVS